MARYFLRTSWVDNVTILTNIFEEERKHDLWYLWPYEDIKLAVPVNDIQPIWNKIYVNLQKRMPPPPYESLGLTQM